MGLRTTSEDMSLLSATDGLLMPLAQQSNAIFGRKSEFSKFSRLDFTGHNRMNAATEHTLHSFMAYMVKSETKHFEFYRCMLRFNLQAMLPEAHDDHP